MKAKTVENMEEAHDLFEGRGKSGRKKGKRGGKRRGRRKGKRG